MDNKILSISIAAYNAANDIPRCLKNMTESSVIDKLDIIVVNDGSKDNTLDVALQFSNKFPGSVRVIDKVNGGHGSTINSGIVEAKGKYFKIVDSDDWVDREGIEKLVRYLENSSVDLVINPFFKVRIDDFSSKYLISLRPESIKSNDVFNLDEIKFPAFVMHGMTVKTSIMKDIGPIIDENCFYVDTEYAIYPLYYAKTVVYLDYAVYNYLIGSATQSMNINNLLTRRKQREKVVKSLIRYHNLHKSSLSSSLKKIIESSISMTCCYNIKLYFLLNNGIGKKELIEFVKWVKDNDFDEMYCVNSAFKRLVWSIFKSSNYFFYIFVSCLAKLNFRYIKKCKTV